MLLAATTVTRASIVRFIGQRVGVRDAAPWKCLRSCAAHHQKHQRNSCHCFPPSPKCAVKNDATRRVLEDGLCRLLPIPIRDDGLRASVEVAGLDGQPAARRAREDVVPTLSTTVVANSVRLRRRQRLGVVANVARSVVGDLVFLYEGRRHQNTVRRCMSLRAHAAVDSRLGSRRGDVWQ